MRIRCTSLVAGFLTTVATATRAGDFSNTIASARAYIADAMVSQHLAGVSVALVASQDLVWAEGFGWEDVAAARPATTATVFRVGSVSKALTGAAALKLAEEGGLDLDAAYTNYLPGAALRPRFVPYEPTVRDLLCHAAGVPGDYLNLAFTLRPWPDYAAWLENELARSHPLLPVGLRENYSNNGFVLAAAAIEAANGGGLSFPAYCRSRLFDPLGMTATSFLKDRPEISNRLAKVYFFDGATGEYVEYPEEFVNAYGTGGAYSRPADLARFLMMVLAEGLGPTGRVLAAESIAEMLTAPYAAQPLNVDNRSRYGLGWDCVDNPRLAHAGKAAFKTGSTLTHTAYVEVLPEHGLGVAVCGIGYVAAGIFDFGDAILEWAVEEQAGISPPAPVDPPDSPVVTNLDVAALEAVAGCYAKNAGYDRFDVAGHALRWHYDAHLDGGAPLEIWPRENGWFSPTNSQRFVLRFTNLSGRVVAVLRNVAPNGRYFEQSLHGEKVAPPPAPGFWPAWSNRIGRAWLAMDLLPEDYFRVLGSGAAGSFFSRDGLLLWRDFMGNVAVLAPESDDLAFVQSLTARCGSTAECFATNGGERLRFGGITYVDSRTLPELIADCGFRAEVESGHLAPWFPLALRTNGVFEAVLTNAPADFRIEFNDPDGASAAISDSNRLEIARPGTTNGWLHVVPGLSGALAGDATGEFRYPLRIAACTPGPGGLNLEWQSHAGRTYRLTRTVVAGAKYEPVATGISGQDGFTAVAAPSSSAARAFFRIEAE